MRVARGRRIWIAAIVAVVLVLVALSITVVPGLLVDPPAPDRLAEMTAKERLDAQNDIRQTLLQAIVGLVLLAGGVATWENIRISRSRRHLEEQGQVTERFTRSVDQLGNVEKSDDVRIGGIFALEMIARDSEDDRAIIAEVLSAFVRGHAPRRSSRIPGADDGAVEGLPASADVQAALTVLGRFPPHPNAATYAFDLKTTELCLVRLEGASLVGANLGVANLEDAILRAANLEHANLLSANLRAADLERANLEGAYLVLADLVFAVLRAANLEGANLEGANLEDAYLEGANLRDASLGVADLGVDPAQVGGAYIGRANLKGAYLPQGRQPRGRQPRGRQPRRRRPPGRQPRGRQPQGC